MAAPSVFQYDNYRTFLRDYYAHMKEEHQGAFSFRIFSKRAGFSSPNFLKLVIDGKRNLTTDSIEKFAKALKLQKPEADFFRNLVLQNQAASPEEKQRFSEQVLRSRTYRKIHPLREAQFRYYTKWYYVPIREMIGSPYFQEDPVWVATHIWPNISVQEAREALETLVQLGMVVRSPEGRLAQAEGNISTDDEVTSSAIAQFHREMMKQAGDSIERVERSKREISSVTLNLSEATAKKIKKMIQEFRKELMQAASEDDLNNQIYQINLQLFPLSVKLDGQEGK